MASLALLDQAELLAAAAFRASLVRQVSLARADLVGIQERQEYLDNPDKVELADIAVRPVQAVKVGPAVTLERAEFRGFQVLVAAQDTVAFRVIPVAVALQDSQEFQEPLGLAVNLEHLVRVELLGHQAIQEPAELPGPAVILEFLASLALAVLLASLEPADIAEPVARRGIPALVEHQVHRVIQELVALLEPAGHLDTVGPVEILAYLVSLVYLEPQALAVIAASVGHRERAAYRATQVPAVHQVIPACLAIRGLLVSAAHLEVQDSLGPAALAVLLELAANQVRPDIQGSVEPLAIQEQAGLLEHRGYLASAVTQAFQVIAGKVVLLVSQAFLEPAASPERQVRLELLDTLERAALRDTRGPAERREHQASLDLVGLQDSQAIQELQGTLGLAGHLGRAEFPEPVVRPAIQVFQAAAEHLVIQVQAESRASPVSAVLLERPVHQVIQEPAASLASLALAAHRVIQALAESQVIQVRPDRRGLAVTLEPAGQAASREHQVIQEYRVSLVSVVLQDSLVIADKAEYQVIPGSAGHQELAASQDIQGSVESLGHQEHPDIREQVVLLASLDSVEPQALLVPAATQGPVVYLVRLDIRGLAESQDSAVRLGSQVRVVHLVIQEPAAHQEPVELPVLPGPADIQERLATQGPAASLGPQVFLESRALAVIRVSPASLALAEPPVHLDIQEHLEPAVVPDILARVVRPALAEHLGPVDIPDKAGSVGSQDSREALVSVAVPEPVVLQEYQDTLVFPGRPEILEQAAPRVRAGHRAIQARAEAAVRLERRASAAHQDSLGSRPPAARAERLELQGPAVHLVQVAILESAEYLASPELVGTPERAAPRVRAVFPEQAASPASQALAVHQDSQAQADIAE